MSLFAQVMDSGAGAVQRFVAQAATTGAHAAEPTQVAPIVAAAHDLSGRFEGLLHAFDAGADTRSLSMQAGGIFNRAAAVGRTPTGMMANGAPLGELTRTKSAAESVIRALDTGAPVLPPMRHLGNAIGELELRASHRMVHGPAIPL